MSEHPAWEKLLQDCCNSTEYCALATHGSKGLWVNPVYFAITASFTLYFISKLDCLHMENIRSCSDAACAIYPTDQSTFGEVYGAYLSGTAFVLQDPAETRVADDIYYGRKYPNDIHGRRNADEYRLKPDWHFVKIVPQGWWYFDTRYFGDQRVPVPSYFWNL